MPFLLLAFIGIPVIEIALFVEVGGRIGLWPTIGLVVATAIAGTALLRVQGLSTLMRAQTLLEAGEFPIAEVFDGLCLALAGALLLTPGFLTDALGLLLFVPAVRAALRGWAGRHLVATGGVHVHRPGHGPAAGGGTVIDGEFEDMTAPGRKQSPSTDVEPRRDP